MLKAKWVILVVLVFVGCQSNDILPKTSSLEYYPIRVGAYWEYEVVETTISQVEGQISTIYELRVNVSDSAIANNETTYILQRWRRDPGTTPWTALDTWSIRLASFQMVQQEGNVPYVKLQFPMSEGKAWNGNALNNLGGSDSCEDGTVNCDLYVVNSLAKPFELPGGLSYDNSVSILENNEDDPIVMKDVRLSVYAITIGLVYREVSHLEYCTIGDCIGQKIVENGFLQKQTLTANGGL